MSTHTKPVSHIIRCTINPKDYIEIQSDQGLNSNRNIGVLMKSSVKCVSVPISQYNDSGWREFFKANPDITPALAKATGKSIENLVMLAHCAGLDVDGDKGGGFSQDWQHGDDYDIALFRFEHCGSGRYKKITVSLPEPGPESLGPLTKAHLRISTAQLERIDALTRENEALKAALECAEKPESMPNWKYTAYEHREEVKRLKAALATVQAALGEALKVPVDILKNQEGV